MLAPRRLKAQMESLNGNHIIVISEIAVGLSDEAIAKKWQASSQMTVEKVRRCLKAIYDILELTAEKDPRSRAAELYKEYGAMIGFGEKKPKKARKKQSITVSTHTGTRYHRLKESSKVKEIHA